MEFSTLEIKQIQVSNLKFSARRRMQCSAKIDNTLVIDIQARHGKMAFRYFRFLLQANCFSIGIEFNNSVALRIPDLISKDACSPLNSQRVAKKIEFPVENVVAQNEGGAAAG